MSNKESMVIYDNLTFGPSIYGWGDNIEAAKKSGEESLARYHELLQNGNPEDKDYWISCISEEKRRIDTLRVIPSEEFDGLQDAFYKNKPILEVDEEEYYEMLNVLPPYRMSSNGFLMSEKESGGWTRNYYKENGKYLRGYADVYDKSTWRL